MDKKFKILEETHPYTKSMHRIRAVKSFGDVEAGDLGGWISNENNLSHEGNCWIYDRASVRGHARVREDAKVDECARVSGNANVFERAHVSGYGCVTGDSCVRGDAYVLGFVRGDAYIRGSARLLKLTCVRGNSYVCGGTWESSPLQIQGTRDFVTTSSFSTIAIGCEVYSVDDWLKYYESIGFTNQYTIREIEEYYQYLLPAKRFLEESV